MAEETRIEKTRPRWLGYAQIGAMVILLVVAIYFAQSPNRMRPVTTSELEFGVAETPVVNVVKPSSTQQRISVQLTGNVRLERRTNVISEVAARVAWISPNFTNGGSIEANQTFIKLDDADFVQALELAEANVSEAEARVERQKKRGDHDAKVFAHKYPTLDVSPRVLREPSIAVEETKLEKAKVALEIAQRRVDKAAISLPFDSKVINADVGLGELVGPRTPLGVVYNQEDLQVEGPIEIRELAQLYPIVGRSANIQANGMSFAATVVGVSSIVAPRSRMASIFLKFGGDAPEGSLPLPGTFAEIHIDGPEVQDVFVLPLSAAQDQESLWVVNNGVLQSVTPRVLGRTKSDWIMQAFDSRDGVVLGSVPMAREGLVVETETTGTSIEGSN